jgi:hypothetical protein
MPESRGYSCSFIFDIRFEFFYWFLLENLLKGILVMQFPIVCELRVGWLRGWVVFDCHGLRVEEGIDIEP